MGDNFFVGGAWVWTGMGGFVSLLLLGKGFFLTSFLHVLCPLCFPLCLPLAHVICFIIIIIRGKAKSLNEVPYAQG